MVGRRITALARTLDQPPMEEASEWALACGDVFSLSPSCLVMCFDDEFAVRFSSDPSTMSVTLGEEDMGEQLRVLSSSSHGDDEGYWLTVSDDRFSSRGLRNLLHTTICRVTVMRRKANNVRASRLPREVGVVLETVERQRLWITHGLHDGSDDFSVLTEQGVKSGVVSELEEVLVVTTPGWLTT